MTTDLPLERTWQPGWPCPVGRMLSAGRRGPGDPTYRIDADGNHWRGLRTPEGPATLRVQTLTSTGEVQASAWGPGAQWVLDQLPAMLGADDDPAGFVPRHPVLARAWQQHGDVRVGRSGLVLEALLPAVIEQKVTGQEAFLGFRRLVYRFGEPAPGPGRARDLWLQPDAARLHAIASWDWLKLHIDPARSRTVVQAARVASSLERTLTVAHDEADRRLRSLPGVGVWTSAEVRQRAHGDADAVSFGDYHVARDVGWVLTGADAVTDDDGLAELLEPYRPHRYRVQQLVVLSGMHRPRRGPRMPPRTHLPR